MPDPCAMGCMPGTYDIDQNPLTGVCGCEYTCTFKSATDPIDDNYTDDNCDGGDGVVEQCVYVSASLGSGTGAGTRQDPVQTIAQGIAVAQVNGVPSVCVSGETYNETVTVVSGINLYGGFDQDDPDFKFRRSGGVITTVNSPGTVFDAPQIDQDTHIEGFTINAATNPTPGGSVYGIRLGGGLGQLFVQYNVINVAGGANGASGGAGGAQSPGTAPAGDNGVQGQSHGSSGGFGGSQGACAEFGGAGGMGGYGNQTGSPGSPGNGGASGGGGGLSHSISTCSGAPSGNNPQGGKGGNATPPGIDGAAGAPGTNIGTVSGGLYVPSDGSNGSKGTNGKGGGGGGGGGGGDQVGGTFCYPDRGGGGGAGGCGGLGGNFGKGGGGGGGSFAVFAAAGKVTVRHNEMTTGGGGKGGNGGNGALGQYGGAGGAGGPSSDDDGAGGSGGNGANGGSGGPGGGGGGGPSACLGYGFGVAVTYSSNSLCQPGFAGQGGAGGTYPSGSPGNMGVAGQGGAQVQIQ